MDIVRRTVRGTDAGDGASGKSNTVVSQGGRQEIGGDQRKDKKTYGQSETSYCHRGGVWGHKSSPDFPFPRSPSVVPSTLLTTFTVVLQRYSFYLDPDRPSLQDGLNSDIYFGRAAWETRQALPHDEENL